MTRYILIALTIVACDYAGGLVVDRQFAKHEEIGYTRQQVNAMNRLVAKSKQMTQEQAAGIVYLWGDQ